MFSVKISVIRQYSYTLEQSIMDYAIHQFCQQVKKVMYKVIGRKRQLFLTCTDDFVIQISLL